MKKVGIIVFLILFLVSGILMRYGYISEDAFGDFFVGMVIGAVLIYVLVRNRKRLIGFFKVDIAKAEDNKTDASQPSTYASVPLQGCGAEIQPNAYIAGRLQQKPDKMKTFWLFISSFALSISTFSWLGYLLYNIFIINLSIAAFGGVFFLMLSIPFIFIADILSIILIIQALNSNNRYKLFLAIINIVIALIPMAFLLISFLILCILAVLGY